jgi:hypothetical protein
VRRAGPTRLRAGSQPASRQHAAPGSAAHAFAGGMPDIQLAGQAERLRSGWLNGVMALPVSYSR